MDVVRGSLREFGMLLNVMTGGVPDADHVDRGQPRRGAVWIVIQVAALAVLVGALFGVAELFVDAPEPGTVATSAGWFLPSWAGLLTLVPAALVAAAVFGAVAPVPARRP